MDIKILLLGLASLFFIAVFLLYYCSMQLYRVYKADVLSGLSRTRFLENQILTEDDMKHLPEPVKKYLNYVGVVGKEKVISFKAVCEGEMKLDPKKEWVKVNSEQYNFFDEHLTRLFYIKLKMSGLPVVGLHTYNSEKANMIIKPAGLITVLNSGGKEMRIGDTTTLFNDMCFFAPAALIDKRIQWEAIDSTTAKAKFSNNGCTISALLYFNSVGELVNFTSDDRFYIPMDGSVRKATWSTPIGSYIERNGMKLPGYGEAVWILPEGNYCYARFTNIKEVEYNCKVFKYQ